MNDMHKLYWSKEVHNQYDEKLKEFKERYFHDIELRTVRPEPYKYHLNVLCAFLKSLKGDELSVLEIGSYLGDSARIFSGYFKEIDCVDAFGKCNEISEIDDLKETESHLSDGADMSVKMSEENEIIKFIFEENLLNIVDNVSFYNMTSDDFFLKYKENKKYDLIYIDGDHRFSQQMRDYTNAKHFLKEGGVLGGHDFSFESTQKMIKEMGFEKQPLIHFLDDSFLVIPEELI